MEGAKLVVEVEAKINNLQTGLNQAGQSIKRFANESAGFLSSAEQALVRYQKAAFNATDEKQLIFYNKRIQETEQEIKKLTNIGKVGFNEFGEEIKKSSSSLGGLGSGATKALSSLRTLAYILPGIGIAGIFNLGFEAIGKVVAELDLFKKKVDEVRQSQIELIKVRQEGEANAQKEIVSLDVLYRATQNQTLSLSERIKAVNILQEKYPNYLKNISDEDILAGKAANAYVRLKDAIIAKALAQSKEDEIAKKAIENDKLKFRNDVIQVAIDRLKAQQAQAEKTIKGDQSIEGQQSGLYIMSQFQEKILNLEKEREQNGQRITRNAQTQELLFSEIESSIEKSGVDMLDLGKNTKDTTDKMKSLKQQMLDLRREMDENGLGYREQIAEQDPLASLKAHAGEKVKKALESVVGNVEFPPIPVGDTTFSELYSSLDIFKDDIVYDLLPKISNAFDNFFTHILETGKFSFGALGSAILKSFASVLASDTTTSLLGLLGNKDAQGKDTIFKSFGKFLGIGGKEAGKGILGSLLPAVAIAGGAIAIGSSLFGHKNRNQSAPQSANPMPTTSGGGATQLVTVQGVLRGRDIVMLLNLEGYYLSRVQQNGRGG